MGTPYHAKKNSDGAVPVVTAGFTPGGHIASGYSYLQRSHSYKTSTRQNVPQGLESPSPAKQFTFASTSPSPIQNDSNWLQRTNSSDSINGSHASPPFIKQDTETNTIMDLVAKLPPNPKSWTPSQVALYLTHVLGLTPKPVVQDVTNYVRSSGMGGKVFLRLRHKDLESEGLNLKWRKLMIEAVKKLRRDCLRGRIWGYEGGLQLPRQEDELLGEDAKIGKEDTRKELSATSMATLKRLRDKKAVRGIISTFENASIDEDGSSALGSKGHRSRGSLSSLHSSLLHFSDDSEEMDRIAMSPNYGKGFVKSLADSYTSLRENAPQHRRNEFTKVELEHWFGSLSDQEAEALISELEEDEELQQNVEVKSHHHNPSSRSYSSHSSISGESEARTPPLNDEAGFDLTPLDTQVIEAIVGPPLLTEASLIMSPHDLCAETLHRDISIDDETVMLERSQSLAQLRAELLRDGKMNLYRASTYEPDDIVAFGLHVDDDSDLKYSTARKMSRPLLDEEGFFNAEFSQSRDSVRVKKEDTNQMLAMDLSGQIAAPIHMRNMTALEASGLSPYKSVSPGMSRSSSQRRHISKIAAVEKKDGSMATFGRKTGSSSTQLTNMLRTSGLYDDAVGEISSASEDVKKAEDESEWGVTISRKTSRRGTMSKVMTRERDFAPCSMIDLFTPTRPRSELNEDNLRELEMTSTSSEHLVVPMTTIEPSDDGKSITRKRSMVLVERKKFEALARRMGVLESQLAQLESASLPSLSNLDSMSDRGRSCQVLDEIFTVPIPPRPLQDQEATNGEMMEKNKADADNTFNGWSFPILLGAIPSYVIGLSAGATIVLLKEVMGKSRH